MADIGVISEILYTTQKKCSIYINEQFVFALYKGELSRYNLKEGSLLSEEVYREIAVLLLKRAKSRSLHLLNARPYTQKQLSDKLQTNGYPKEVIEQTMEYVKSFGYINDNAYVEQYINNHSAKKSMREMKEKLLQKGIKRDVLEAYMETFTEEQDDTYAIKALLKKKRYSPVDATVEETRRIYAYLARKGFRYDDIHKVLQVSDWNT